MLYILGSRIFTYFRGKLNNLKITYIKFFKFMLKLECFFIFNQGGFSKFPGGISDPLHSTLSLYGLSIINELDIDFNCELKTIDCILGI